MFPGWGALHVAAVTALAAHPGKLARHDDDHLPLPQRNSQDASLASEPIIARRGSRILAVTAVPDPVVDRVVLAGNAVAPQVPARDSRDNTYALTGFFARVFPAAVASVNRRFASIAAATPCAPAGPAGPAKWA